MTVEAVAMRSSSRFLTGFVALLFFTSGCASLIFEVVWSRRLALVFGSTVQSVSTTAAAFLLGLGIGAVLAGRFARGRSNLLLWFSLTELTVAISGLALTALQPRLPELAASLSQGSGSFYPILRFTLVFLSLLIPCTAMGATLPILSEHLTSLQPANFGGVVGMLYGVNTLGAATGAFLTDALLVRSVGVYYTAMVAAALYICVACAALLLARASARPPSVEPRQALPDAPHVTLAMVLVISSAVGMICQVGWTRVLVFVNGGDMGAYSLVLVCYLLGLVGGSLALGLLPISERKLGAALSWTFVTLAFLIILGLFVTPMVAAIRLRILGWNLPDHLARLLSDAVLILPATLCLGMLFPLVARLVHQSLKDAASSVALCYAWSTVGSVLGALATGFVLLPNLGLQTSLLVAAGLAAFTALALPARAPVRVLAVVALVATFCIPREMLFRALAGDVVVLYHGEDSQASVYVTQQFDPTLSETLRVDGFNMAGDDAPARRYTTMLALMPYLLHNAKPRKALVICLGMGNTSRAAVNLTGIEHVDNVELSSKVLEGLGCTQRGRELLDNPKLTVHLNDGRNYLLTTREKYDLITAEPPPPALAGVVNLYTREYYELCRQRLNPGGVVAQWLPTFQLTKHQTATVIRAFREVFPDCTLWQGERTQLILVGTTTPMKLSYRKIAESLRENSDWLRPLGLDRPELVLGTFLAGPEELARYTANTPILEDDRPYLEYPDGPVEEDINFLLADRPIPVECSPSEQLDLLKGRLATVRSWASLYDNRLTNLDQWILNERINRAYPDDPYFPIVLGYSPEWEKVYRAQSASDPTWPVPLVGLAGTLFSQQRRTEARDSALQAAQLYASSPPEAALCLALAALAESRHDPGSAREVWLRLRASGQFPAPVERFVAEQLGERQPPYP